MSTTPIFHNKRILVLGGGAFGSSAAYSLARHAFAPSSIVVVDRSDKPGPAPDAASSDINKIVRSSYWSSDMYSAMGAASLERWRQAPYAPAYHDTGLILTATDGTPKPDYVAGFDVESSRIGYERAKRLFEEGKTKEAPVELPNAAALRRRLPEGDASLPHVTNNCNGYFEALGGWANASQAMTLLAEAAQKAGVEYESGYVTQIDDSGEGVIIKTEDGRRFEGDMLIVASGAWTPSLLPEFDRPEGLVPTGQVLATIQLTPEEAKKYKGMPVILDIHTEYYMFELNEDNIVKIAIHGFGCTHVNPATGRSEPLTHHFYPDAAVKASDSARSISQGNISAAGARALRQCLARILPDLAQRDFSSTRTCWYTETPDSDFLVDQHPFRPKLWLSTGGSGHGFKFLPILGDVLVQRMEGTLPADQSEAFSATRERKPVDRSHTDRREVLDAMPIATEKELKGGL